MAFTTAERVACVEKTLALLRADCLGLGDRVPGEAVLSRRLGASRHLVRLAFEHLVEDGVVERRGHAGSFLIRPADDGAVAAALRSIEPAKPRSSTISLMLVGKEFGDTMPELQEYAMSRSFMLHTYFASEHGSSAEDERRYLEQAAGDGYRGAVIHPTPLPPDNDEFFRRASAQLRLAHVGHHAVRLPEQSFFLPDLSFAAAACVGHLKAAGCSEIVLATTMPEGHHTTALIRQGMDGVASALSVETSTAASVLPWVDGVDELRTRWLAAGPELGIVVFNAHAVMQELREAQPDERRRPRTIAVADRDGAGVLEGVPAYTFSWRQRVRDALDFVMADGGGPVHKLYLPEFRGARAARRLPR